MIIKLLPITICTLFFNNCYLVFGNDRSFNADDYCLDRDDINTATEILDNRNYSSIDATFFSYNSDVQYFFSNLQGNMARNVKGTCGYIAICMLLSYLDTYYNDNIIPENYDIDNVELATVPLHSREESPGVLCEAISDGYITGTSESYNNLMTSLSNISLHAKLLTMNNYTYGTGYYSRISILTNYLNNYVGFTDYSISGINRESYFNGYSSTNDMINASNEVRNFIINSVVAGNPVVVGATNSGLSSHHAFVVYGYNSLSDTLVANMGWGYGNSSTNPSQTNASYCYYKSAMVVNLTSSHYHSNNYVFRSSFNNSYSYSTCGCGYTSHNHNYSYTYAQNNKNKHKAYCSCSNYILEVHFLDFEGYCIYCGYRNNYFLLEANDDEQ